MKKWGIVLSVILLAIGCKKPFTPSFSTSDNNRYLVVEGIISGTNDSTFIRLSRTKKIDTLRTVFPEPNARVSIESDANTSVGLTEKVPGTYVIPPLNLDATRKYRLRIKTSDNKEYASDFVAVKNVPPIDSLGFEVQNTGVQIYVNTHDAASTTHYYRWEYTEDWQFHSVYASGFDNSLNARVASQQIYNCFGSDQSSNIIIASTLKLTQDNIYQQPITFIPESSEKIETKYAILVKQYALTSDAYSFWENLQKNTEKLGSIFDAQPSEIQGNFHCISNPGELVIGYLSVGNASYQRIFITKDQLLPTYNTVYPAACELDTAFKDPDPQRPHIKNFDIFFTANSPYVPVSGLHLNPPPPDPFGKPNAYTYSTIFCVDCTIRGTRTAPPYWK